MLQRYVPPPSRLSLAISVFTLVFHSFSGVCDDVLDTNAFLSREDNTSMFSSFHPCFFFFWLFTSVQDGTFVPFCVSFVASSKLRLASAALVLG